MIDLAALAALCFDASKEWTEPKVARFDPLGDAEKEKVVLNLRKKGHKPPASEVFVPTFAAYLDHSAGADQLPARAQRHRDYARLQAQRKPQPQDQNRARCRLRYRTRVIAPPRQNGSPHYNDEDRAREQIGVGNARKHLLEGRSPADGGTNCFGMLLRETGHSRVPAPPHMITGMI